MTGLRVRSNAGLAADRRGSIAVEFALLMTVMVTVLFGIGRFGIALYNKIAITDAARAGVREVSIGRTSTTVYTDTTNRIKNSAPGIALTNSNITVTINGTVCTTDTTCIAAMVGAAGMPATVRVQWPCNLKVLTDFAPGCQLTGITTQRVE